MAATVDVPYFTLNNGVKMPGIGAGCFLGRDGGLDVAKQMVANALKVGYRHLDTASGYRNEELVGEAIRESGIPRSEIFVTTKLPHAHHVRQSFEESLSKLNIDYIDLYLIHFPQTNENKDAPWMDGRIMSFDEHPNFVDAWREMEKLLDTSKVRAIGVSNFSEKNLDILLQHATVVPAVNQVECHPCLPQFELQKYCQEKGILLSAYSPFGMGNPLFFPDPDINRVAAAHNATPAQVTLSWLVQRGIIPLPKSEKVHRMKENITLVQLTPNEMETVSSIHKKPAMHRSLLGNHTSDGKVFGWTYEELGWPFTTGGFVKT